MKIDFDKFELHVLPLGPLETNCYILINKNDRAAAIIDPAEEADFIYSYLIKNSANCTYIILTHGHYDHIGALNKLADKLHASVAIHTEDKHMLQSAEANFSVLMGAACQYTGDIEELSDGDEIIIGDSKLKVIHTPGHTAGGICLYGDDFLLSGDTLFQLSVGRSDFPGGSSKALIDSIKNKLLILPPSTPVFPGHGPSTTIEKEHNNNPFLR
ncbi:MBL fold metallo-hydrolase [bacterium]|nr:MBL fold metallo-hydrolase [bacterium]